ncbi:hypothetical protein C5U48_12890 [Mycolicibacter virginiensis]|uniref:Uncharacterized protein n=1 Tax=Mycolicibacter virginiensis TaxID=1795032 RepID=A0A9X7NYA8_9MYCO|nr:hypothetical protein [Mycolicibacter virginiensis]PQM51817.1 hypothetical protein C5U48_12890 [Mycolicibacter virginiensis]
MTTPGQLRLSLHRNDTTGNEDLRIDHADPHVLFSDEIIDAAIFRPSDQLWMDFSSEQTCFAEHQHDNAECFRLRSVLHVKGTNREVLYRITGQRNELDTTWHGQWPD